MTHHTHLYTALLQLIDASHASDPNLELDTATGQQQPKESLYAQRMTDMLTRLAPEASEAVYISVRAQHIQRWMIPRSDFPMTTLGYKQWRARLYKYHAEVTAELMHQVGYDDGTIARVKAIVGKLGIKLSDGAGYLYGWWLAGQRAVSQVIGLVDKNTANRKDRKGRQEITNINRAYARKP